MVSPAATPAREAGADAGMAPPRPGATIDPQSAMPGRAPDRPGLAQLLKALLEDVPGLISDRVHLAALELKRARQALVQMIGLAAAAVIFLATAWLALWALLIACAVIYGLPWIGVFGFILLINLAGSWFAVRRARALADYLALPATVRRLSVAPPSSPGAAKAENPPEPRPAAPGVSPT